MASKEQQLGIEQINDAVTQLDQKTQQNASVASHTKDIAVQTQQIAYNIVEDANEKEFIGKDTVKVKTDVLEQTEKREGNGTRNINDRGKAVEQVNVENIISKPATVKATIKPVVSNSNNDEWASF